jgi:DNA modification methylase
MINGLKPKDLLGIPWRVAFALQADGWYLRQDIIWAKPNPMPESVTDRCTKAHEYIFLLSKSARYYFDAEAIKEPAADPAREKRCEGENAYRGQAAIRPRGATRRHRKPAGWDTGAGAHGTIHRDGRAQEVEYTETEATNRNKRSVWTIPTAPYSGAHFATFPPALIVPCILAGCPAGGTVLDPFGGSGTTGDVASGNGRRAVLVELNPEYAKLAQDRCGLFCSPNRVR